MRSPSFVQSATFWRLLSRPAYAGTRMAGGQTVHAGVRGWPSFGCIAHSPRSYSTTAHSITRRNSSTPKGIILKRETVATVEEILQHKFKDRSLLAQAMAHRSVVNTSKSQLSVSFEDENGNLQPIEMNNERLELLGDRVFGLLTVETLYRHNITSSEGELSIMAHSLLSRQTAHTFCERLTALVSDVFTGRTMIVSCVTLFTTPRTLGLDRFLLQSEKLRGQKGARYGDMFEALLGALFVDGGYEAALAFFQTRVVPIFDSKKLQEVTNLHLCRKQELQEYLVSQGVPGVGLGARLKYVEIEADYIKQAFTQGIELFGRRVSLASAGTRMAADQAAAEQLLSILKRSKGICFLIRLARNANDMVSLTKLQAPRAAQIKIDENERSCEAATASAGKQR